MKIDWLSPSSRYYGMETLVWTAPDGTPVPYFPRRILPDPNQLALLREHLVLEGERPDLTAAAELADPELFWRLCDGNPVLRPEELTERVGRWLRVTLPGAIPVSTPTLESFNQVLAQQIGASPPPKAAGNA